MSGDYEVVILKDGYSYLDDGGRMRANCTCSLIKGPKNVVVDTLTPWDSKVILDGLAAHGLAPDDVEVVVSTHGHPDHTGNNHLFLNALHLVGFSQMKRDTFLVHPYASGEAFSIDGEKVKVIPTPGHTLDSVSVRVVDANRQTVVIAGDLFEREEDIAVARVWQEAGSDNPSLQAEHRAKVLLDADVIVPGHGPMFRVTEEHRKRMIRPSLHPDVS